MEAEQLPISEISADPVNARKHSEKNIEAIKGSLRRFGQQKPIVVDQNGSVVAGNGTLQAAKELGWETIAICRSDLAGPERIAFALADNRTTDLSEWDDDILGKQLQALYEDDFDIEEIGFELKELGLDAFDQDLDNDAGSNKEAKYIVEVEFPNEQIMRTEYNAFIEKGLIARIKGG